MVERSVLIMWNDRGRVSGDDVVVGDCNVK